MVSARPVNMMGASKRIMEMFLLRRSLKMPKSTARFANVAFSDGSLLHGFNQRIQKRQPLSSSNDVKRYFVTPKESGELCLMSYLLGENRDVFFPKLNESLHLISFADIAVKYLKNIGYEPFICKTEEGARELVETLPEEGKWPCYFFYSNTTSEKDFVVFYTNDEVLDMNRFENLVIIKNTVKFEDKQLQFFSNNVNEMKSKMRWRKEEIVKLFFHYPEALFTSGLLIFTP
jgi:hypothetical protein